MHPIVADQVATERLARRRAEAEVRRRLRRARPARPAAGWRGRPARWLVALARRLDPGIDVRTPVAPSRAPRRA